jgi:hypothetical protein
MDLVGLARQARASRDYSELRVCADWLEQQGDPARGALVHLQCELAELEVYDRRAIECRWEIAALLAVHGERWRAELPELPGIEWTDFELGCIAAARVRDVEHLCRYSEALASAGLVHRIELVDGRGELDPEAHLDFVETIQTTAHRSSAFALGSRLELELATTNFEPEIVRTRALDRLSVTGCLTIGDELARLLATLPWAKKLTELEIPTQHVDVNTGYGADDDPTLGVEGAGRVAMLKSLERLNVDRQRVTTPGLRRLAALPNLRALSARECGSGKLGFGKGAPLVELDLSSNRFKGEVVRALLAEPRLSELRQLVLDTCELESLAVSAIIASPMWHTLRIVDLSRNPLGAGGARTLADAPAPKLLHTVVLADADLDDKAHAAFAKIPWLGQLLALDLSGNMLGRGAVALRAIAPERLRRLSLATTGMERADAAALARFWPQLVELALDNNPLGNAALERFAVMREATRLQTLELRDCLLTDDGLELLGNARCPHLRSLALAGNTFGPGLEAFLATPACARLEVLDLARCDLAATTIAALVDKLPPTLRSLDLRGNALAMDSLVILARAPALRGVKVRLDGQPWTFPDPIRDELAQRFGPAWYE